MMNLVDSVRPNLVRLFHVELYNLLVDLFLLKIGGSKERD